MPDLAKIYQVQNDPARRSRYKPIIHPQVTVIEVKDDGYWGQWQHLFFIVSIAVEDDGKSWLHASVSRTDKQLPNWGDLADLKRLCVGEHRTALQVFPPKDRHVNLGPVLHLWSCMDGEVTPDFTCGTGSI